MSGNIEEDWSDEAKERQRKIGVEWIEDSSLERWFPFTAQELTTLRDRVKELEAENKHLKCELDDRNATLGFVRKKFETTNECYIELLRKFSECNQRLEALESKQAIKLTEQICVEGETGVKNIRQYASGLQTCQGCGDTPLVTICDVRNNFVNRCAKCGRVL